MGATKDERASRVAGAAGLGAAAHEEIAWLSARELLARMRARELSAVEVMDATLARIEALDADLGAFLEVDAQGARRAARRADDHLARGRSPGTLHGLPVCIKDLLSTAQLTTTFGSTVYRDHVPSADAPAVERLRAAGAIVVGKSNTPEFGLAAESFVAFGPRCCNPWNRARTSGGSSGGTAAAVSAGLCPVGLGTDAGGSIRLPAAWCGVVGLKPTYGRVPLEMHLRADHPTATAGPMARSVADIALVQDVIAGADPRDPSTLPVPVPSSVEALDASSEELRIGWTLGQSLGEVDPPIARAVAQARSAVEALGVQVVSSDPELPGRHPFLVLWDLLAATATAQYADIEDRWADLTQETLAFLEAGSRLSAADYVRATLEAKQLRVALDRQLEGLDAWVLPATAVVSWPHGEPPTQVAGQPAASHGGITYGGLPFLALANLTGHPAVSVPVALDPQGLPIGLQVIGRHFDEPRVLLAAQLIEQAVGFDARPPLE